MTNTKTTKRALLSSVMALFLCFAMLLGTTYAWFTDSVTSSGNIIKSGTLDVEMYYADGKLDPASATWEDASTKAIFDYDNWEPGYTDAKHIKIANEGTLDLQWQLAIVPNGSISELAEVIDVYYVSSATAVATRDDVDTAWYVGSLASVINGGIAAGDLTVADKEYTATIVLKMKENAGNEYQNLSIGDSFSVKLFATQLDSEEDSFGKDYDADIVWDGTIPTAKPDSLVVDTTAKVISINDMQAFAYLNTLVNDANFVDNYGSKWQYTIELNTDIDLFNRAWTPIVLKNFVAFEGNGHTISNLRVSTTGNSAGLFGVVSCNNIGVTYVRNLTIDGAVVNGNKYVGAVVGSGTQAAVENVTVNNAIVGGIKYVGGIFGSGNGSVNGCTVKNSTITINQVVIDPEDNSIDSKEAGGLIGYLSNDGNATTVNKVIANNTVENVTITAPSVASGLVAQPNSSNSGGALIEIKNNTMKNVTITTTKDATAALYASNNVGGKSIVADNTATDCKVGREVYGLTLFPNGNNSQIIVNDKEGFLNLSKLSADWRELFTDGNGSTYTNYASGAGVDYYYSGRWTIVLDADIDLNNNTIAPVKLWVGEKAGEPTFDGQGHTIKNAVIVTDSTTENEAGLFVADQCIVKNLKLDNIHVTGSNVGNSTAGVLSGSCNALVDKITITNSSVTGGKYTGGVVGYGYTDITNCTLTNVTVKGGYKLGGIIGYICANNDGTGDVTGNTLTNCTVDGIGDGVYAGGKNEYVIGQVVGNYNGNGTCNNNTVTGITSSATDAIGKIEDGKTVTQ